MNDSQNKENLKKIISFEEQKNRKIAESCSYVGSIEISISAKGNLKMTMYDFEEEDLDNVFANTIQSLMSILDIEEFKVNPWAILKKTVDIKYSFSPSEKQETEKDSNTYCTFEWNKEVDPYTLLQMVYVAFATLNYKKTHKERT